MEGQKKTCGARTRAGTPCQRPAGWGTKHPGSGKCKLHGGASTGPKPGSMKGNQNALKHGIYSKFLPKDTLEIVEAVDAVEPIDILWQNIKIQYATILRSQNIMYVKNKEEMIRLEKKIQDGDFGDTAEYEFHTAWDRQERFMTAQARAMATLTNMIGKYDELCKSSLATEEQKLRTEKIKAEIDKIKAGLESQVSTEDQLKEYFEALGDVVKDG